MPCAAAVPGKCVEPKNAAGTGFVASAAPNTDIITGENNAPWHGQRTVPGGIICIRGKEQEKGRAGLNSVAVEVRQMIAAIWLLLSSLFYSLQLSTGSFPRPLTAKEEQHYLTLSAQGDMEARNILVERNLRLVAHIMKKYYAQTSDQEDLISIGTIGLIKGISTFDASRGARLATYAARCVENEILMYFRGQRKSSQDVSLSDFIETGSDGAELSLMEVISSDEDLLETVSTKESVVRVRQAVDACLSEQERLVIRMRYGLDGGQPKRQREVAQRTGISRSYVSRIEKRALQKLRTAIGERPI